MSEKEQHNEMLSAYIDAEQSDIETLQIVDALLNNPEYKEKYIRSQLVSDSLHDHLHPSLLNGKLQKRISLKLEALPAHFVDDAVDLQAVKTQSVPHISVWSEVFRNLYKHKMISGLSVAASVMFVTLFALQHFAADDSITQNFDNNRLTHSLKTAPTQFQTSPKFTAKVTTVNASLPVNDSIKKSQNQQYHWIEADPQLSRQVRQYINEHEIHRATYNMQPKIRAANYQINKLPSQ